MRGIRLVLCACLFGGLGLTALAVPPVRAQDSGALAFFTPAQGVINDAVPVQEWTFDGSAGQVVSLVVITTGGDLDPTLQVIGPDGATVGENDDLDALVTDAGLEALALPAEGTYTARVGRYQGAEGTTAGQYELTLTPGFARVLRRDDFEQGSVSWSVPGGDPAPLAQGRLRLQVQQPGASLLAVPPDTPLPPAFYFQAEARIFGTPAYAETGLAFRVQGPPGAQQSYQFRVNTQGAWSVLYQDFSGVFALQTWTAHPALTGTGWTLAVLGRGDSFTFYANGAQLGTLSDTRLAAGGTVGVLAASSANQAGFVTLLFDNALLTARLGTTYQGMPLALANWDAPDPAILKDELFAAGQIDPAPQRDLFIPDKRLAATDPDALFDLVGSDQALYADFLLGASVKIVTTGNSVGCGLAFRWQDERNLGLAFIDSGGGFGLVQAIDGALTTNVYDRSRMVSGDLDRVLIVARGNDVALYLNGALVAQETFSRGRGRVGVALLNYEDVSTDCLFGEIWVWPLNG